MTQICDMKKIMIFGKHAHQISGGSSANFLGARELKLCLNAARSAAVPAKNYKFCALVRTFCFFGNKCLDFSKIR